MTSAAAVVEVTPRVVLGVALVFVGGLVLGYVAGYGNGAQAVVRLLDEPTFLDRERKLAQLRAAMGLPRQGGYPVALAPAAAAAGGAEGVALDPEPTAH